MNDRQRLFIDGIRYSIDMAAVAFGRLCAGAQHIYEHSPGDLEQGDHSLLFPAMFLDAWSVVDSVHRLRTLVRQMPGLANSPQKTLFLRRTAVLKDLRNAVQHLCGTYQEETTNAPWGSLSWAASIDGTSARVYIMVGGAMAATVHPAVDPLGASFRPPIDLVELTGYGTKVSLSEIMDAVSEYTKYFEESWRKVLAAHPATRPSDTIICLHISANADSESGGSG